jgi:tRNA threonylcarbamoyladenosine biosynthesis protein TsaB
LIAINTLKHISLSVSENFKSASDIQPFFCPMLDARRMEVYCALFDSVNSEFRSTSAEIIDENSFSDVLKSNPVCFFGDGAEKCKGFLSSNKNSIFIDNVFPSAKNMITLSQLAFENNEFEDVAYFEPFYLKDFLVGKKKGTA